MNAVDLELLERWRRERDAEAFAELVGRYSSTVYGTCWRVLGNASDAEEVAQECFLELAQAGGRVRRSLGAWLHAASVCRSLDRIKSDRRRRRRESVFAERSASGNADTARWADVVPHVDEAIAQLPEPIRELIVHRYLEGKRLECIARETGQPRSTVQYRLGQGVESIRKTLRDKGIPVRSSALSVVMSAHMTVSVPPAVTGTLGKIALAGLETTAPAAISLPVLGGLAMSGKAIAAAAAIVVLAGVFYLGGGAAWKEWRAGYSIQSASSALTDPAAGAGGRRQANPQMPSKQTATAVGQKEKAPGDNKGGGVSAVAQALGKLMLDSRTGTGGRPVIKSSDLPLENGAHYFLLASELLPDIDKDFLDAMLKEFEEMGTVSDPARLQALFDSCQASIDAIRQGLETGNAQLPPLQLDDSFSYLSKYRDLTRVMGMEARMLAASGDYAGALDIFETALDFVNESVKGGTIVHGLIGYSLDRTTTDAIQDTLGLQGLDQDDYRYVIGQLQRHTVESFSMRELIQVEADVFTGYWGNQLGDVPAFRQTLLSQAENIGMTREQISGLTDAEISDYVRGFLDDHNQALQYFALPPHEALAVDYTQYYDANNPFSQAIISSICEIQSAIARNQAEIRGTEIMAAVDLYRLEHAEYPASLDALAPECLTQVPMDPFTNQPFSYTPTSSGYLLYSAGSDMELNGASNDEYQKPGGDLVLHKDQAQ